LVNVESVFVGEEPKKEFLLKRILSDFIEQSRIVQRRRIGEGDFLTLSSVEHICSITLCGHMGIGHTSSIIDTAIENRFNSIFYSDAKFDLNHLKVMVQNRLLEEDFEVDLVGDNQIEVHDGEGVFYVNFKLIHEIDALSGDEALISHVDNEQYIDAVFIDKYSRIIGSYVLLNKIRTHVYQYIATGSDFFFVGVG
jgi:hypothetical protein